MNKPAPKEPSMDEILSSIRQIIADDDAGPRKPAAMPASPVAQPVRSFAPPPSRPAMPAPDAEPLALSPEQILRDSAADDVAGKGLSFEDILGNRGAPEASGAPAGLIDPEDVAFEADEDDGPVPMMPPMRAEPPPAFAQPVPAPRVAPRPVAAAAPMPDPMLSRDLAEELLEPTTQSAVKSTFAKLNSLSSVGSGVTIEDMMRDMLRPMLKEWLDENLPSVVERMVEKEIARVSRGGR